MPVVNALLGAVVLLFGRSLYWLFIGVVGFLLGMRLAELMLADQQVWLQVLLGVGAGLLGALVAVIAQRVAFAIGGFFAGGYLAIHVVESLSTSGDAQFWMILGGILGAVLAALLMDWALIFLSSLAGAAAIVAALPLDPAISLIGYVLLVAIGVLFQAWRLERRPAAREPDT